MNQFLALLTLMLIVISSASNATPKDKNKRVTIKCYVQVDSGKNAITLSRLPQKQVKDLASNLIGQSVLTSLGPTEYVVTKVHECVPDKGKFKDVIARVEDVAFER